MNANKVRSDTLQSAKPSDYMTAARAARQHLMDLVEERFITKRQARELFMSLGYGSRVYTNSITAFDRYLVGLDPYDGSDTIKQWAYKRHLMMKYGGNLL